MIKLKPNPLVENLSRQNDIGENRNGFYRLDKNERVTPFNKSDIKNILKSINDNDLSSYADQSTLYKKISKYLSIDINQILITPGSDAAIKYVFETFVSKNDLVGYLNPTYAMIEVYANLYGAKSFKIGFDKNLNYKFNEFDKLFKLKPKIIFIANPNQPTGTIIPDRKLDQIINKAVKLGTLIVLDQAYIEFSKAKKRYKDLEKLGNLIITNTFSKAFGLAGTRIGYMASSKKIINLTYRVKPLSDINILAIKSAEYLLKNKNILNKYVKDVNASKILLKKFCDQNQIEFINSEANFIHMRINRNIDLISKYMRKRKYLIRTTGSGLPATIQNCIRITLGPPKLMKEFIVNFKEALSKISK